MFAAAESTPHVYEKKKKDKPRRLNPRLTRTTDHVQVSLVQVKKNTGQYWFDWAKKRTHHVVHVIQSLVRFTGTNTSCFTELPSSRGRYNTTHLFPVKRV